MRVEARMPWRFGVALVGVLLAHSASARADDELCPRGQEITSATAGRCCWPAQAWDESQQSCTGKPACPPDMVRNGLVCMAAAVPPSAPPASGPPAPDARSTTAPREKSSGGGLIIAGAITLGVGYLIAIASASVGSAIAASDSSQYGSSCASGAAWSYVPLIGPFITLAGYPDHQIATYKSGPNVLDCKSSRGAVAALVWTDELLQLGGAAMLTLGIIMKRGSARPDTVGKASLELVPGAPSAPLGMSVVVTTF
jgi:hypothetical protein